MKKLLPIFLLIIGNSFAQNTYNVQKDAIIYDLLGGDFITATLINDKTHLKHYDIAGNIIWEDSLAFQLPIDTVSFQWIANFKGTNEYIVCMSRDLTLNTPIWLGFDNDTIVYQFSKFDISNHQFTNHYVDTFITSGINSIEFRDTSIYLVSTDKSINPTPFNHKTYSLNPSLQLTLIAPLDSVIVQSYGLSYFVFGDSIYKYQYIEDFNAIEKFTTSMSIQSTNYASTATSAGFNFGCYRNALNYDSLFVFTQGTTSGSYNVKWRMDWMDLNLSSINSIVFNSPVTTISPLVYSTNFYKVALDKVNRRIMVLADENGNLNPEIPQKVFVFDFNFNPVCELPITLGSKVNNTLIELNGLVYLKVINQNDVTLKLIDCEQLGFDENRSLNFINIYPNPVNDNLVIDNQRVSLLKITISSAEGKLVKYIESSDKSILINSNDFKDGIYFVSIIENGQIQTEKIIKN